MDLRPPVGGFSEHAAPIDEAPRAGRTPRDWAVDVLFFCFGIGFTVLVVLDGVEEGLPAAVNVAEAVLGGLASAGLWSRRCRPVAFAVVIGLLSVYSVSASGLLLLALFTVAVHRRTRTAVLTAVGYAVVSPLTLLVRPDSAPPNSLTVVLGVVCVLGVLAWGMYVRSRRLLARAAEERRASEAEFRIVQARQTERHRIAREMHDVLAHRLSLLSLQAAALELNADGPRPEIARAAGAIRGSAHGALEDLREVIGVLRDPRTEADGDPERPQPTLADLPELIEASAEAAMRVSAKYEGIVLEAVPEALGRTAYRIVQEGLTNARKHTDAAEATVTVQGEPGEGLTVVIDNPLPDGTERAAAIPGAGMGLVGLAERVELIGGHLRHGPTPEGRFELRAWLPWPR